MSSINTTSTNSQLAQKNTNPHKNRKSLLLVFLAFALPIILAKLALEQEWLDLGVTNQGTLLNNELTLKQLGLSQTDFSEQWLILYALPKQCLAPCLKTLETVHNSYVVLGKDMPRVTPVLLTQTPFSSQQAKRIAESQWQVEAMPVQSKNIIKQSQVFIVDPLGNVILSHFPPLVGVEEQAILGKAIIADMKKLLKYSKVG
jgi:hypothetical protein